MQKIVKLMPYIILFLATPVVAQDCSSLQAMGPSYLQDRQNALISEFDLNKKNWANKYILDNLKIVGEYGSGSERSYEGPDGSIWVDNSKRNSSIKISYEIPLKTMFQIRKETTAEEHLKQATLDKATIEFNNLVAEWRIANNTLERKKMIFNSKKDENESNEKRNAMLDVEDASFTVERLRKQLSVLLGRYIDSNACI